LGEKSRTNEETTGNNEVVQQSRANPMAGRIPALLQMPVFYALFQFFPSLVFKTTTVFMGR
jgi:YidC/Oxa1 family membrane protein insertase